MVKAFNEIRISDIDPNQYVDEEDQDEGLQEADATNEVQFQEVEFLLRSAFPLRLGCFAHALQLVIMQIFKDYQKAMVQADAKSWIREKLKCVMNASSSGIDPLKWWINMLGTDAKPLAILALEVLTIPATSDPIEHWQNWQFKLADCQNGQYKLVTGKTGKLALVVGKTSKAGSDTGTGTFTTASLAASASLATTSANYENTGGGCTWSSV
uniref:Transposase n=1 Tax=Ditylenchus dipsaci TaxID=166011 RepID=A0A915DV62_9BILA